MGTTWRFGWYTRCVLWHRDGSRHPPIRDLSSLLLWKTPMKLRCVCDDDYVYDHKKAGQQFKCRWCGQLIVMPHLESLSSEYQSFYRSELQKQLQKQQTKAERIAKKAEHNAKEAARLQKLKQAVAWRQENKRYALWSEMARLWNEMARGYEYPEWEMKLFFGWLIGMFLLCTVLGVWCLFESDGKAKPERQELREQEYTHEQIAEPYYEQTNSNYEYVISPGGPLGRSMGITEETAVPADSPLGRQIRAVEEELESKGYYLGSDGRMHR